VSVSLAARKSKLSSAALNVAATDPEKPVLSALAEVVSADASTVLSPLGSVSPPAQVIEARLALTVLSFKSVKLRGAAVATWIVGLPVVLGNSMTGCDPASAASTGGGALSSGGSEGRPEVVGVRIVTGCDAASLFAGGLKLIGWS
jgi:hypothetical protein